MTIGFFVAVGVAFAQGPIRAVLDGATPWVRRAVFAVFWVGLLLPGAVQVANLLRDSQAVQRQSLDFVHRNFENAIGFHPESALFCQRGGPFPTYFSQTIDFMFTGPKAATNVHSFIGEFARKPVGFLVESWRLYTFPSPILRFWEDNYQLYHGAVWTPRIRLKGTAGASQNLTIVFRGPYRWQPDSRPKPSRLKIGNKLLGAKDTIRLQRGRHRVRFLDDGSGSLFFAVTDAPDPRPHAFYKPFSPW
jgi:hypothetical protein